MIFKFVKRSYIFLNILCFTTVFATELRLGSPFQEHMVLQRDLPIKIWGEASPKTFISISINKKSTRVKSDSKGKWTATLPAYSAGGPFVFSVSSPTEKIEFKDVLIGDVWICSGQSNMYMGYQQIPDIKALESDSKNIRTFTVENTVAFTEQDYLNGKWELKNPNSAVAFSFAYFLQKSINIPVGIILSSWGSSSIEGWMPRDMVKKLPHFKNIMNDFDLDTNKKSRIDSILTKLEKRSTKGDIFLRTQPNIIYNSMMKPLAPYTCRGIVWYQGEANSKSIEDMLQYGTTLKHWIKRLRKEWKYKRLYVLGVMLPGYGGEFNKLPQADSIIESPNVNSWAWIRESQIKALKLPNTGIVTTIDLGEQKNIHPKDKLQIGERLALLAEKKTLHNAIIAEGPAVKNISVLKKSIVVTFKNVKILKTLDGKPPKAFWLSDDSKKWFPAITKIIDNTVLLTSSKIENPLYVRYAFSAKPKVNLVNEVNLPTRPFRTDCFAPNSAKNKG